MRCVAGCLTVPVVGTQTQAGDQHEESQLVPAHAVNRGRSQHRVTESRKLLTFKRRREKLRTPNQSWLNLESTNGTCESLLSRRDWPVSRSYKEKRSFADSESGRNWTHVCRLGELLSLNLYPGKKTIWRNQGMLFHFLISCLSWVSCNHGVGEVSPDVERNRTLARPPRDASSIRRIMLANAANARDVLAHQQF